MNITKTASAHWEGNLKEGKGSISTESGALNNQPYSFTKRFGEEKGTNPEELIGAAHSGCFTMAFSAELMKVGITARTIDTEAKVTLTKEGEGFSVTRSHLTVSIDSAGADESKVKKAAETAKTNCPISKLLRAEVTMELKIS